MSHPKPVAVALAAVTILIAARPPAAADPSVTLVAFIAANATDPWDDIVTAFEAAHPGVVVKTEFAGSQILETQAEQGAPFDVFLSADSAHADALQKESLVAAPVLVSQGHEVIVVPKDNPAGIASLQDLGTKPLKLVLGVDTVPIGIYTRQVLANAAADYGQAFPSQVLAHAVSFETNVKQVLEKVSLGEADAGIVYFTDVTPAYADKIAMIPIPPKYLVEAGNYLAVATHSSQPALAAQLAAFAESAAGEAIFVRHGYDPIH